MRVWLTNLLLLVSIAAVSLTGWAAFELGARLHALPDLTATVGKLNTALDALNAGCKDFQGDYQCGPILQASQTEKDIGILAARSAQQVQQTGTLVTAVAHNLDTVGDSVKTVASSLSETATAATGTLQSATATVDSLRVGLAPLYPASSAFLSHSDAAMTDLDARIRAFAPLETNLTDVVGNVKVITSDFHVWSHPFLNPEPCEDFKCRFKRTGWPLIKDALGLGADANQVRILLGNSLPVTLK